MNRIITIIALFLGAIFTAKAGDFVFSSIDVSQGLSDNQIRYILQLPDGRMVFATSGNLNVYDGARFKYIHRTSRHVYPLSKYDGYYRIYQSKDSLLWIKDTYKLMCVDLRREKYIADPEGYFAGKGIDGPVEDLFVDAAHRLWLLIQGKLWRYGDPAPLDIPAGQGKLQDLTTEENNLYLFYHTGEVECYDLETKKRLYSKPAYPAGEQASFGSTSLVVKGDRGFYQLRNGNKGGFFFFDTRRRAWEKILETPYTLNTLIVNPDETAYISCAHGIWVIDCRNGGKRYLPVLKTVDGDVINTEISTLFYDRQGGLWLGTFNRGLLYYHPSRYKFSYIGRSYFAEPPSTDMAVQAFAEDKAGNIYVKTQSGAYRYHPAAENGKVLTPVSNPSLPETVRAQLENQPERVWEGQYYTALCTDARGWVWAGTQDGLKLFKTDTREERLYYTDDGLANNFVHAILEDKNQNIWVTTSYGISRIQADPAGGQIRFANFNTYDGTLEGEYAIGAAFEATDGTLYFGGVNGFNTLRPESASSASLPFKPVFTGLRLRGEKVEAGNTYDGRVVLPETAPYTKEIDLSHHQNFLTFEFSALNYQNPSQTHYRYQLTGIDADWREVSTAGQDGHMSADGILRVSYTNLPHGKYLLNVMASDNNRQWDGAATQLKIAIHAPWWDTPAAYFLYALLLLSVAGASIYLYIHVTQKKLRRQHREEILLLRIRNLIEQRNAYEEEQKKRLTERSVPAATVNTDLPPDDAGQGAADTLFLARAIEQVEKHLNEPGYSVEQLSRDLCMERTGLYRKLIALLDKSPTLFIRHIRLQRAARLILEEELSIAEIAERVGFSSSSYLSKCFQEMYGCRPSEYAGKVKEST